MARLPSDRYTIPWGDAEDCPCGSGHAFVKCCKVGPQRLPYIEVPNLRPPGKTTGYAHPKCYMSGTNNCSKEKSREHYVSEAILERFDQLNVSGMPWQARDESKILPANALAGNILCTRHNTALGRLDELGLKALDAVTFACDYAVNATSPGRVEHFLMSGEGLELWLFKLAAGIHFGGIATDDGVAVRDKHSFPIAELADALSTGNLPTNANLWVAALPGVVQRAMIQVAPLIDTATNRHIGVQVRFGPLRFETTLVAPPLTMQHLASLENRRRPRIIDFIGPARDARVILSWKGQNPFGVNRLPVEVRP